MAGILDNKTRIMDVIVTKEGKRQMAAGMLRAEFVSFTDGQAYYEASISSGSTDASNRVYFEAISRLEDMITLETDDSGQLLGFNTDPQITLVGNKIFTVTGSIPDNPDKYQFSYLNTGSLFASVGNLIATSSINNFKNQYLIGTRDDPDASVGDGFEVNKTDVIFNITNSSPFDLGPFDEIVNVDVIEPIFLDKRLSHLSNFKFLPPETHTGEKLGNYSDLNQQAPLTYSELMAEIGIEEPEVDVENPLDPFNQVRRDNILLTHFDPNSYKTYKPRQKFTFTQTSTDGNIVAQIFELNMQNSSFTKLDVIDFGTFYDDNDDVRPEKHVFFAGKVYIDSNNIPTFVNLFTIIMD